MLYWAPILLCPGGYFLDIGNQTVGIAAVLAVDFLDRIQISEPMAVHRKIRPARNGGDTVNRKAHPLINGDPGIQQEQRHDQRIDDRSGQQVEQRRLSNECSKAPFMAPVRAADLFIESDPALIQTVPPALLLRLHVSLEIVLGFFEARHGPLERAG